MSLLNPLVANLGRAVLLGGLSDRLFRIPKLAKLAFMSNKSPDDHTDNDNRITEPVAKYTLRKLLNLPIDIFRGVARDLIGISLTFFASTGVAAGICLYYGIPLVFSWIGGLIAVGLLVAFYYYE